MGERLTDDEIDQLYLIADTHTGGITMSRDRARKMLTELRERRASALTTEDEAFKRGRESADFWKQHAQPVFSADDIEALAHTIDDVERMCSLDDDGGPKANKVRTHAIALLRKLLATTKGES